MTDSAPPRTVGRSPGRPAICFVRPESNASPKRRAGVVTEHMLSVSEEYGVTREQAHLPAEQPAPQPHPWFPSADAHPSRARNPGRAPPQGPRQAGWLTAAATVLPRGLRMRSALEFRRTIKSGVRVGRPAVVVSAHRPDPAPAGVRVGLVVSKAVGNAVTRNRVKRRLRHLCRPLAETTPTGTLVVVRALPRAAAEGPDLAAQVRTAWRTCLDRLGSVR